jgi:hypothetical protein
MTTEMLSRLYGHHHPDHLSCARNAFSKHRHVEPVTQPGPKRAGDSAKLLVGVAGFEPATPTSRTWFSSSLSLKNQRFSSRSRTFVHVRLLHFGAEYGAGRTHSARLTDNPDDDDRSGSSESQRSSRDNQLPPTDQCWPASTKLLPYAAKHAELHQDQARRPSQKRCPRRFQRRRCASSSGGNGTGGWRFFVSLAPAARL